MAKQTVKPADTAGVNKSQFIRDELTKNKKAMLRDVVAAWKAAGHPGEIGAPIFYFVKSKFGTAAKRRGRPRQDGGESNDTNDTNSVYLQIESELDKLITKAPDFKIAEALRTARRRVSAKLLG